MTKGIRKILISGLFFVLAGCLSVGFIQSKSSVIASANELKAEEGAQTRLVEPYGLRFSAYLDEEKYQEITDENGIKEGKTVGLIVAPTEYFEDYTTYKAANPEYAGEYFEYFRDVKGKMIHQTYNKNQIVQNTGANAEQYPWMIRLSVVDMLFNNVDTMMSSVAYIQTDGVGYEYADVSNGRSVSYVASAYLNAGNSSSFLEDTLTKFAYKQLGVTYDYETETESVYLYKEQAYTWNELQNIAELNPASVYAFSEETVVVEKNTTKELSFVNQKVAGLNVKWTTENENIVRVENGVLTAVESGETVVTAQIGQYSDSVVVTVMLSPVYSSININTSWAGGGALMQGIEGGWNTVASVCSSAHHIAVPYAGEMMDTLTLRIASGNWVGGAGYNSLLRIKLAFNGITYTYNANNNTWVDALGAANPCIAMTYADGTEANLAAMTSDTWVINYVTFTISQIYTDLQIVMAPPVMGSAESDGCVDLAIAYSPLWEDKLKNDDVYSVGAWLSYDAHWSTMTTPYTGGGGYLVSQADGNKGFFITGYVEGVNKVAVKMSALSGFVNSNSLLRLQLRYNGTTYTYDSASNTWKDGAGNVAKVTMKYEDGTDVNLGAMTNYANVPVLFIISDITTDLKLVLNPPAYNSDDEAGRVHIDFYGSFWYSK